MTRSVLLSAALHGAVLFLAVWVLARPAGGFVPVSVRLGTTVSVKAFAPTPSLSSASPAALIPASGSGTGAGAGEPVIDTLTPGPASETPSLADYPSPGYPDEARKRGWEGSVEVEVEVSARGAWSGGRLLRSSGHVALDDAALDALRRARYVPAEHNGVPQPGVLDALVRFRL